MLSGKLHVRWARQFWLRALLFFSSLPRPSQAATCQASIYPENKGSAHEIWRRLIGGRTFSSRMEYRAPNLIVERIGPLSVEFDVCVLPDKGLTLRSRRAVFLGLPLHFLSIRAGEYAIDAQRYRLRVHIWIAGVGSLLRYDGVLEINR